MLMYRKTNKRFSESERDIGYEVSSACSQASAIYVYGNQ